MASTANQVEVCSEIEECMFAMVIASACAFPMTLKAAIELEMLETIAKAGPGAQLSPSEIAAHITNKNAAAPIMLDRILRLLTSYSILTCSHRTLDDGRIERLYGLAPVCKFFVRNEDDVSIAPYLELIHDKVMMESWYHLKDAVVDGGVPFDRAIGMSLYEYARVDARINKVINTGMLNHSTLVTKMILEIYTGFEGLNSLVDVGGGVGVTLNEIVSKYPKIKGINFDLPHVVAVAPRYSGVEHIGGDMFAAVPRAEAIFMKSTLHGWSDELCTKLLKNCYEALPDNGKVIALEHILPSVPDANITSRYLFQMDLLVLAFCGGRQRTKEEFEELAKGTGFAGVTKACTAYSMSVLEFYKK